MIIEEKNDKLDINIDEVISETCKYFNVDKDSFFSKKKGNSNTYTARSYIMYILHEYYGISYSVISSNIYRTERNVIDLVTKMKWRIANVKEYSDIYNDLITKKD